MGSRSRFKPHRPRKEKRQPPNMPRRVDGNHVTEYRHFLHADGVSFGAAPHKREEREHWPAKPGCRSCHGTGKAGVHFLRKLPIICACVIKRVPAGSIQEGDRRYDAR